MTQLTLFTPPAERPYAHYPIVDRSEEHALMPILYSYAPMIKRILRRAGRPVRWSKLLILVESRFGRERQYATLSQLLRWMVDQGELAETRIYYENSHGYHSAYSLPKEAT